MHNAGRVFAVLVGLLWTALIPAQPTPAEPEATRAGARDPGGIGPGLSVPRLIKFGGALKTPSGGPLTGAHGVALALYKEQQGGAPVWMESQNVELDLQGRYTLLLGATKSAGVPLELFTADEPRWLGVQVQLPGYQEEARVLLVSVPYALKAADAERLGGKPLSAFVMVPEEALKAGGAGQISDRTPGAIHTGRAISLPTAAVTTANYIAMFLDGSGTTGNSTIYQSGSNVGIGTITPGAKLEVTGPVYLNVEGSGIVVDAAGFKRMGFMKYAGLEAAFTRFSGTGLRFGRTSSLDVTAGTAGNFTLEMLITGTGNVGIGTPTPSEKLDVAGNINASGNLTASGTVTAASLSGSGASLTSLNASNLSTGTVANARTTALSTNTANAIVQRDGSGNFAAGTITATAFVGGGALITGVNAASLNGVAATNYARTDVANNLTGTQAITGPVSVRSSSTVEQLNMDTSGNLVALGSLYVGQGNFVTPTGTDVVLGQVTNGSTISNVFRVDSTGKGYFNGGTQTGGADFAESFAVAGSRAGYEPGDVLVIDPLGRRRMALSTSPYSTRVSGIHSTKPGVLATPYAIDNSSNIANEVPLAVIGVVPCKVSAENGVIAVGDLLVTSSTPGHAMRGSNRKKMLGAVVGKALEPLASGKGVIQVLVTLQ